MKKKVMRWLGISVVVLIAISLMAGACAPKPAPELPPVKIGAILELTGIAAVCGPLEQVGIEYALDEVGWEIEGRKIELIVEDGAGDPVVAVDKARKLVEHDEVDVIIGPLLSSSAVALATYLAPSRTPNISVRENPIDTVRQGGGNVFVPYGTLYGCSYPLGLYAYDVLGYRKAVLLQQDYVAGWEFGGGFAMGFEERGGEIVQIHNIPFGTIDFAPYLTATKEADAVAFFLTGGGPHIVFPKQAHSYGLGMPLLCTSNDMFPLPDLIELADVGLGMVGVGKWSALIDVPENKAFVEGFTEKFGSPPDMHNECAYLSTMLFLAAVSFTGGDTSHEAIIDALHEIEVDSPQGMISFNPEGMGVLPSYIFEVVETEYGYDWASIAEYPTTNIEGPGE